ncbi:hypothetical protein M0811_04916 [Anaeramoeba ignava]|uniref:Transmembrane protein n=1 Tax=Anaeramoeba ignava TaxID=1746090 RepID=A0A9Q0LRP7_ANAIG|nr:hypothetical protein M0811_04916 [Anaeramoeba ignava]
MGELENPVYTPIDSDDLEDGINLRYFVDYNGKHIRSMFYNLFCSNYETWRVVTVFYHSTLLPPSMEINVLTSSTCFNTQPVPVITQSCSKCNAAGASFGVISALCFGVISGFFFYKWRSKEISTTYERV